MSLTKDYKETVVARVARDPEFAKLKFLAFFRIKSSFFCSFPYEGR